MRKLLIALALLFATVPAFGQESLLSDITATRNQYPDVMTREQAAEMLNSVASRHPGWGMLQKGSGNSCPLPNGVFISCDILIHKGSSDETSIHYDVASGADFGDDAHGRNMQPVFNSVGPCVLGPSSGCSMTKFLSPIGVVVVQPPVVTAPPVGPQPVGTVDPRVLDFMNAVAGALDSMQAKLDRIVEATSVLVARPTVGPSSLQFPTYRGSLWGQTFTLTPQGGK